MELPSQVEKKPVMNYVGKYVCYGNDEEGFCVAKIIGTGSVNTPDGPKDVFIVDDRICGQVGRFFRIRGRTNLRVERLNLMTDVFNFEPGMGIMTDEQLFLTMLNGRADLADGVPLGLANMLTALKGQEVSAMAKEELEKRQVQEV